MNKNVTVLDEQGNYIGATYPKRARGLVKHGRARFIDENDENVICLINAPACPPDIDNSEENTMDDKILFNDKNAVGEIENDKAVQEYIENNFKNFKFDEKDIFGGKSDMSETQEQDVLLALIDKTFHEIDDKRKEYAQNLLIVKDFVANNGSVMTDAEYAEACHEYSAFLRQDRDEYTERANNLLRFYRNAYETVCENRKFAERLNAIRDTYIALFKMYSDSESGGDIKSAFEFTGESMHEAILELIRQKSDD